MVPAAVHSTASADGETSESWVVVQSVSGAAIEKTRVRVRMKCMVKLKFREKLHILRRPKTLADILSLSAVYKRPQLGNNPKWKIRACAQPRCHGPWILEKIRRIHYRIIHSLLSLPATEFWDGVRAAQFRRFLLLGKAS